MRWSDILMCFKTSLQRHGVSVLFIAFPVCSRRVLHSSLAFLSLISNGFQVFKTTDYTAAILRSSFFIYYWNSILHCTPVDSLSSHLETIPFTFVCDFIFGFTTNDSWTATCVETLTFDKVRRVFYSRPDARWPQQLICSGSEPQKKTCCAGWKENAVFALTKPQANHHSCMFFKLLVLRWIFPLVELEGEKILGSSWEGKLCNVKL